MGGVEIIRRGTSLDGGERIGHDFVQNLGGAPQGGLECGDSL